MWDRVVLDGECNLIVAGNAGCAVEVALDGDPGVAVETGRLPVYDGPTEITPSEETQVLQTDHHAVRANITINPIPSNYGLITWDGHTITVS